MRKIDQWFEKAAKSQNRVVTLFPSLLRNKIASYFAYRLRYLFSFEIISFSVHVAEFFILLAHATKPGVILVVLLRAGAPLVRGAWWGAMEVLRERLRALSGPTDKPEYEREISHWLVLSVILALVVFLCGLSWLFVSLSSANAAETIFVDIYILLITVELALRIPILTLHSGIYSNRRIYRPFLTVLAPILLQAAAMASLFGVLHEGSLIVSIILSGAFSMTIGLVYIKRMYRVVGISPTFRQGLTGFFPFLRRLPLINLMWSTLAGLLIRIDGLLVPVLLGLESIGGEAIDLTAGHPTWKTPDFWLFLYLVLPAIRGAYEWSALFYFDFVRLRRSRMLRDLARGFMAKLVFAAVGIGLFFWALATTVFLFGFADIPFQLLVAMIPLFLLRAWLAVYQIRAFADARFVEVCVSVGIIIAGLVFVEVRGFADIGGLAQIDLCLLAGLIFLIAAQILHDHRTVRVAPFLALNDWGRRLAAEAGKLDLGVITVARKVAEGEKSALREMLEEALEGKGRLAWLDDRRLIYYERVRESDREAFDPYLFVEAAGGLIALVRPLPGPRQGGGAAIAMLRDRDDLRRPSPRLDIFALIDSFRCEIRDGIVLDLQAAGRSREAAKLDKETVASAIPFAMRALRSGSPYAWCGHYRLYAAFLDDNLRALFFVPSDVDARSLKRWDDAFAEWQFTWLKPSGSSEESHT
ncbi:hypothetical protein Thiowin_02796 [Thiorhodovibrio winogradskyi]|uniref:Uncharacterized protein n=1 Tax=Thiorhodovibrio winogradskyi TaxID=77007 RepID=A0ABZ0SCD0_9GAMM|nr:hypothetical protein [Thiorhodovibrio winogradskyi]